MKKYFAVILSLLSFVFMMASCTASQIRIPPVAPGVSPASEVTPTLVPAMTNPTWSDYKPALAQLLEKAKANKNTSSFEGFQQSSTIQDIVTAHQSKGKSPSSAMILFDSDFLGHKAVASCTFAPALIQYDYYIFINSEDEYVAQTAELAKSLDSITGVGHRVIGEKNRAAYDWKIGNQYWISMGRSAVDFENQWGAIWICAGYSSMHDMPNLSLPKEFKFKFGDDFNRLFDTEKLSMESSSSLAYLQYMDGDLETTYSFKPNAAGNALSLSNGCYSFEVRYGEEGTIYANQGDNAYKDESIGLREQIGSGLENIFGKAEHKYHFAKESCNFSMTWDSGYDVEFSSYYNMGDPEINIYVFFLF